jgi:hypothetical protein
MAATHRLDHFAYCGMPIPILEGSEEECRQRAARRLSYLRSEEFPIITRVIGREWEICEPEDCCLVPDLCGILAISPIPQKIEVDDEEPWYDDQERLDYILVEEEDDDLASVDSGDLTGVPA